MTQSRLAPEFAVEIAGRPVPAELRGSVTSVVLQSSLNAADRVELALANERLRWLDSPLFRLDNELALSLGYAPDPLEQMFAGRIVGHAPTFPSGGMPTLTIAAQDRITDLQRGTKERWFAIPVTKVGNLPVPDTVVSAAVSAENGLLPALDPVGAALSVVLGGVDLAAAGSANERQKLVRRQHGESDFDFLGRLARENGWELTIDHGGPLGGRTLRFFSPLGHLAPDVTLAYGSSLLDFTPRLTTVGQIASVTVHVWVPRLKTQFAVTLGWDWDRNSLTIDIASSFTPQRSGEAEVFVDKPVSLASAPRMLVSRLVPKLNERLTGSGTAVGDPRIKPGTVLALAGLGIEFSGFYRVTGATHSLGSAGYRTSFDVRKEIWFGSIPLPAQGAVPIRVTAPGVA